jgi:hypothetical protein
MNYIIDATLYKTLNTSSNNKGNDIELVKANTFNYSDRDRNSTSTALQLKGIIKEKLNVPDNAVIKLTGISNKELVDTDMVTDYNVHYIATIPAEPAILKPETKKPAFKTTV